MKSELQLLSPAAASCGKHPAAGLAELPALWRGCSPSVLSSALTDGARSHLHLPEIREFILFLCLAAEFLVVMNEAWVPLFIMGSSVNGTALNYLMRLNLLMSVVIRAM